MLQQKRLLYLMTGFMDIFLLWVLYRFYHSLKGFDKGFVITILLTHVLFYWSIYTDYDSGIDISHILLLLCVGVSPLLVNKWLLGYSFLFVITLQVLWFLFDKCILITDNGNQFGFGNISSILAIVWSLLLFYKLRF